MDGAVLESGISVCVPVRDEEASLPSLLDSLSRQTLPPDEIVLADGGSKDNTVALARGFGMRGVRVLTCGPAFPGRGRNLAIAAAAHKRIALIDAGCVAHPDWLSELAATQVKTGAEVVLGNYRPTIRSDWELAQALVLVPAPDPTTGCRPPFIASTLINRDSWLAAGGFPEHLRAAEDLLFFERLLALGLAMVRCPSAYVDWSLSSTPAATLRRLRLYSRYHLAAGLGRTWHLRVMAMDGAGLLLTAAALWWPPGLALALAGALARLLRNVGARRGVLGPAQAPGPGVLARAAGLICLADAATWLGALDHVADRARFSRKRV